MNLKELARGVSEYEGVKRKRQIGVIAKAMGCFNLKKGVAFGDDAAIIKMGEKTLLFACDSINQNLIEADPFFAGYSGVLVNVNDIAAMGGTSIAMVDVLCAKDEKTALEIADGLCHGSHKFGVPIVGGHLNPNTGFNAVEVSILGKAPDDGPIKSSTARPGDAIILAVDLDGRLHPNYGFAWDSTSQKTPREVQEKLALLPALVAKKIISSGRDVSNPGIVGTAAMLLEQSRVGGVIQLDKLPCPKGVDFDRWLLVYPGFGFIFTAAQAKAERVLEHFHSKDVAAEVVGRVQSSPKVLISWRGNEEEVFDLDKEKITGV